MTLTEAAVRLGRSPSTLRVQIRKGKFRAKKVGRDWMVTSREVERYRAASLGRHQSTAASRSPIHSPTSATTPFPQQR